jgi:hypothetical protein
MTLTVHEQRNELITHQQPGKDISAQTSSTAM